MATALDAVTGVSRVYRAREADFDQHDTTALKLVDRGDTYTRMVHCYEGRLGFEIRILERDYAEAGLRDTLAVRRADVHQALTNNEFWNGLAVETTVRVADEAQSEALDPLGLMVLEGEVLYRTPVNDPYKVMVL
jgi:hypothetical protein